MPNSRLCRLNGITVLHDRIVHLEEGDTTPQEVAVELDKSIQSSLKNNAFRSGMAVEFDLRFPRMTDIVHQIQLVVQELEPPLALKDLERWLDQSNRVHCWCNLQGPKVQRGTVVS